MNVIDCTEMFKEKQEQVMFDRALSKEFNIAFIELPEDAEILIHGDMISWFPEED